MAFEIKNNIYWWLRVLNINYFLWQFNKIQLWGVTYFGFFTVQSDRSELLTGKWRRFGFCGHFRDQKQTVFIKAVKFEETAFTTFQISNYFCNILEFLVISKIKGKYCCYVVFGDYMPITFI